MALCHEKNNPIFWIICSGRVKQIYAESPDMGNGEYWFSWENTCHLENYGRASCSILWVTSHQWKRSGASMTTWLLYRGPSLLVFNILRVMLLPNLSWKSFLSDKTSLSTAIGWQGFEKGRQDEGLKITVTRGQTGRLLPSWLFHSQQRVPFRTFILYLK